jgi:arylsulfatase A-like enzyme
LPLACNGGEPAPPPNVVWVVWDTVRADHLSLYGYSRPTTPFVDEWAKGARVWDDCLSTSSWTVPSHASMFTGLLPAEHGAMHGNEYLDDQLATAAELLRDAGYGTFAWAANPHVSREENFLQGFEIERHPWDADQLERAQQILETKIADVPEASELNRRKLKGGDKKWVVKAAGELARENFSTWLEGRDAQKPFLAFFNFMEAHRPLIPPRSFREKMLAPAQVEASYRTLFEFPDTWAYCFGLREYAPEELELMRGLYDAALLELDGLFRGLMAELDARGLAENSVVILTADHGEHLGEGHLLDHQYSLSHTLLRVPLAIRFPKKFAPGRDARAVTTMDLFPTVLELAGVKNPGAGMGAAHSLLSTPERRPRMADYSTPFAGPLGQAKHLYEGKDFSRFERGLVSIIDGRWKLVREIGGPSRLYDLSSAEGESRDVGDAHPEERKRLQAGLRNFLESAVLLGGTQSGEPRSDEHQKMLEMLGYALGKSESEPHEDAQPAREGDNPRPRGP